MPNRVRQALIGAALIPAGVFVFYLFWIYLTWAMQASTAGWLSAIALVSLVAGVIGWFVQW